MVGEKSVIGNLRQLCIGTAFMTANMDNINTWPNIYHEGETYISYDFDFKNLNHNLQILINDVNLWKNL